MILLFLGSWRSTLVVMISIPLAILTSLVVLYFLGETLNTMTLGGLALAVGILVDDSTVTIENTHRLLTEEGMPLPQATLHGAAGIAVPDPGLDARHQLRVHLGGLPRRAGRSICSRRSASPWCSPCWRPTALSRTLTPIMIGLLLKGEHHGAADGGRRGWFGRFHAWLRARLRADARRAMSSCSHALLNRSASSFRSSPSLVAGARRRRCSCSSVATSSRSSTAGRSSSMSARRPARASKRPSGIFQAVEDKIREVIPESDRAADRRQHRPAGAGLQSRLLRRLDDRRQ